MRVKYAIAGVLSVAVLMGLPAPVQATYPGENGEIAMVSGRSCTEPCDDSSSDVFLLEGIAFDPVQLTTDAGQHRHPSWSPDLEKLAYARWGSGSRQPEDLHRRPFRRRAGHAEAWPT